MVLTDAEIEREQRMLTELRAMRRAPQTLSTLSKKRLRIPRADDDNPFCAERQVTDASSLARFNKNPQLHAPPPSPPKAHPRNHSDNRGSAQVKTVLFPAYGGVVTVRLSSADTKPTLLDAQTKKPIVTFGHRPQSASRHFDPASLRLNVSAERSAAPRLPSSNVGMPATALRSLLHPPKPKPELSPSLAATPDSLDAAASKLLERERGFDNRQHHPTKVRTESLLNVPADASVAELLQKFRKLSAGANLG
ncbi:hypothetical protein SPRG_19463 [Saprolegnia parasitica CBS 223.65]|uniref:Uncharacterized protein n=1 Tax=Saprolegnia parasitica (strain CBS 223.65) TaxID=695850 RepID=A0A067CPG6_SAPPC|nr:hypothetical protein SPRG_19463 [Saprolegnia parasitica CBS 223.65]KDO32594.1 hypothetical protein SPRG_19463 [Saprolegnia parasitica CBS 223.65]|eukprot:XP_012197066.1 hypothetical protein SPRG_19463 [Saprolegnia parasitica CBS 223.65]